MDDHNDIAYWYPILQKIGVKTPKTVIVKTESDMNGITCGERPYNWGDFLNGMSWAARNVGYPVFLRTGYTSCKHSWLDTCWVKTPDELGSHIVNIIEECQTLDLPYNLPTSTWAIREALPLASAFTAFNGTPVSKERRYFISGPQGDEPQRVLCHHPHWPKEAIRKPSNEGWEKALDALNFESDEEVKSLTEASLTVAKSFRGAWSLDWAMTIDGQWWVIDMAGAARSYHWPGCDV